MSWVKTDDRYDDHKKVKRAWKMHRGSIGLHAMAKSYSARHETDGVVDLEWIEDRLPDESERSEVLHALMTVELFEFLPAGTVKKVKVRGHVIRFGPLGDDVYIVHDYLEYNEAKVEAQKRRQDDAARKANARKARGQRDVSARTDGGIPEDSREVPGESRLSRPDPTRPDPTIEPPNPQGGDECPVKPSGNRLRDHSDYREQIASFVAEYFPGKAPEVVAHCAMLCRRSNRPATPANLAALVAVDGVLSAVRA